MKDLPGLVLALTINSYWACVILLAVVRGLRQRQAVGLIPWKRQERLLWAVWVPVIVAWNLLPWVALSAHRYPWGISPFLRAAAFLELLRSIAAVVAGICFLLIAHCWLRMGRSWSLAVVPDRGRPLVQTGIYGWVRHPIYALSILLMLASLTAVPTAPLLVVALLHVMMLMGKARSEEESLLAAHGPAYRDYSRRTGRFLPRLSHRWRTTS